MFAPTIHYRPFRNSDAPHLLTIWNEVFPHRGAYTLRSPHSLERWVFSKGYFDPQGLIVAEADGLPVGFVHAGFAPTSDGSTLDHSKGVLCMVAVRIANRRQKIGTSLVRKAEEYLHRRGATGPIASAFHDRNPFYFGLYGGSNSPGVLASDAVAHPFLLSAGYTVARRALVYQRPLDATLCVVDSRFLVVRRRYEPVGMPQTKAGTWWQENVFAMVEPSEYKLIDKATDETVARAMYWEMEGYGWRWGVPSIGIVDLHVREDVRKQGLAKFLLSNLMRYLQQQDFRIVEMQVLEENLHAQRLFRSLGFQLIDTGVEYIKTGNPAL